MHVRTPTDPLAEATAPAHASAVSLHDLLEGEAWREERPSMALPLILGRTSADKDLVVDLARLPHLLVAGELGSAKAPLINAMLVGLLLNCYPGILRLLMIDPTRTAFPAYAQLPHLLTPVVTDSRKAIFALRWAIVEMNRRHKLLLRYGVRSLADLNRRVDAPAPNRENPTAKLPHIVIAIDALEALMHEAKDDIEPAIAALASKAHGVGIHLLIATQSPTTDVLTATLKANLPGRLALRVPTVAASRAILEAPGAETLSGTGDLLLKRVPQACDAHASLESLFGEPSADEGKDGQAHGEVEAPLHAQAAWLDEDEVAELCAFIREQDDTTFDASLTDALARLPEESASRPKGNNP